MPQVSIVIMVTAMSEQANVLEASMMGVQREEGRELGVEVAAEEEVKALVESGLGAVCRAIGRVRLRSDVRM